MTVAEADAVSEFETGLASIFAWHSSIILLNSVASSFDCKEKVIFQNLFDTFEFYEYIGVPLKLKIGHFRGFHLHFKNYNSSVSRVHTHTTKRKNCLYAYFLNTILLRLIFTNHNFVTSI